MKDFNEVEYNKLCSEFLDYAYLDDFNYPEQNETGWYDALGICKGLVLKFDSDWNWIMEVIEKIESIYETKNHYGVLIDITTTHISIIVDDKFKTMIDLKIISISKKQAVVQAIWEFLNWYNTTIKMQKETYVASTIEVIEVVVEKGFAGSGHHGGGGGHHGGHDWDEDEVIF